MLDLATCHCGTVSIRLSEKPATVFECNCSICRRLGVLWAYYHCDDAVFESGEGTTRAYAWNHRILALHSCATCGCTTHWIATDPAFRERMGVNARLIDGLSRENTAVDFVDHGELGWFWCREPGSRH